MDKRKEERKERRKEEGALVQRVEALAQGHTASKANLESKVM